MADIQLTVGVDTDASFGPFQSGIEEMVAKVNKEPFKIKVELDESSMSNVRTTVDKLMKGLDSGGSSRGILDNVSRSAQTATGDINALTNVVKELSTAMGSFKGININLAQKTNPIMQNVAYSLRANNSLSELQKQAEAIEAEFMKVTKAADGTSAAIRVVSNALGESKGYQAILQPLGVISDVNAKPTAKLSAYKEYISLMQQAANIRGIDLSGVTSSFEKSANEVIEDVAKFASGEKEAEESIKALQKILGTPINSEGVSHSLSLIVDNLDKLKFDTTSIDNLIMKIDELVEAFSELGVASGTSQSGSSRQRQGAINEYANASKAAKQVMLELRTQRSNLAKIGNEESSGYKSINSDLSNHSKLLHDLCLDYEQGKISAESFMFGIGTLKDCLRSSKGAITEYANEQKNAAQEEKAAAQQRQEALNAFTKSGEQAKKLLAQLDAQRSTLSKSGGSSDSEEYRKRSVAIDEYAQSIRKLCVEFATGKISQEQLTQRLEKMKNQVDSSKKSVDEYVRAQKEASKETANESKRVSTLTKLNGILRNATAAQTSNNAESREAFGILKNLASELDSIGNKYKSGEINSQQYADRLKEINAEMMEQKDVIQQNGDYTKTWSERVSGLAQKFSAWLSVSQAIMFAIRGVREMVSASIELDSAMTQLKIVTDETDSTYQKFADDISKTAQDMGVAIKDLIDATTTYARLGYTLDESSRLAEYTGKLQAVGNIEPQDAQNAVTAMVKAFKIDVDDLESVMDKLVVVGNGAPISVSQIAEAMNNASSSLSAAGNTIEQSIALMTSANTTIQNASRSSTGLRTIAARIRNVNAELTELGEETLTEAQYDEIVKALTQIKLDDGSITSVSLTDAQGQLRSTYDIIKDIAAVWKDMEVNEQAALAKTLAGKFMCQNVQKCA